LIVATGLSRRALTAGGEELGGALFACALRFVSASPGVGATAWFDGKVGEG